MSEAARAPTGAEALRAALPRLAAAGIEAPAGDARRLLAHALGIAPERLTLHLPDPLPPEAASRFAAGIDARCARQPVSQITGSRLFWGREFTVTPDVLDPRPETEILIDEALAAPFAHVLDLGTGSGAILLTLLAERPAARGQGVDISDAALAVARTNARRLGLEARVSFTRGDWFDGVAETFDLVVSNPPYIAEAEIDALSPEVRDWEPRIALTPGGDGLAAYRRIAAAALQRLVPGGRLLVEIGWTQGAAVATLFEAAGLSEIAIRTDLDGRDRVVSARRR